MGSLPRRAGTWRGSPTRDASRTCARVPGDREPVCRLPFLSPTQRAGCYRPPPETERHRWTCSHGYVSLTEQTAGSRPTGPTPLKSLGTSVGSLETSMNKRVLAMAVVATLVAACGGESGITAPSAPLKPTVLNAVGVDSNTGATIETSKDDYVPGEVVHLTGRGWAPNEIV